ncbi:hypothetical protein Sste5346_005100 [Sporothrix stenoceras]|uniref:Major facilitator superfamily (MFS) profile domain-containing protein n=1 Tax=Sporothrix stenoceras TaxID=5173 RepID=A0ABR3Z5S5_9PEZI
MEKNASPPRTAGRETIDTKNDPPSSPSKTPDIEAAMPPTALDETPALTKPKLVFLLVSVLTSMFLVALDRTIISTAIPQITDEFHSLPDVGWYGSAYLLTCCSFQLLYGKIYTFFPIKWVFLFSILLFEVGSTVCGAAPTSAGFIVGRAVAGVGAAGIFAGAIVCIVHAVPLEKRPRIQGLFGALFGLASIVGPLIGGAFTSNATWRWCFYINLPFGGIASAVIFYCLDVPDNANAKQPLKTKLKQLDGLGTAVLIPGVVSLLLALQWGGQTYQWDDRRIIVLLALAGVLLLSFVAVQVWKADTATIPPRIFHSRSVVAAVWSTINVGCSQYIYVYFLPVWFQSIKGSSAVTSGIQLLPLMLSMVLATIVGGFSTQKVGYYTPFAITGACLMSVAAGLLTTLQPDTPAGRWIGYQILYGFGMGLVFQAPNLAVQTVLPRRDVPVGTSLMFFSQLLGASLIVSIGENVLDNQLVKKFAGLPGFDPSLVTSGGATALLDELPADVRPLALPLYNEALRSVFRIGLVVSCLSVLGAAALEWKSILKKGPMGPPGAETEKAVPEEKKADSETTDKEMVGDAEKEVQV